jgi:hypothetical protein
MCVILGARRDEVRMSQDPHTQKAMLQRIKGALDLHGPVEAALYVAAAIAVIANLVLTDGLAGSDARPVALVIAFVLLMALAVIKVSRKRGDRAWPFIAFAVVVAVTTFLWIRLR